MTQFAGLYTRAAMQTFLHRCLTRTPLLGLLMAAVVFRALIPVGFMAAPNAQGVIVMQLCSGFGSQSVTVDLGDNGAMNDPDRRLFDHSPCGFAAATLSAPSPAAASLAFAGPAESPDVIPNLTNVVSPSIARAQSPRAPPLS